MSETFTVDPSSRELRKVKITIEVEGGEYLSGTYNVQEFAIPYVTEAAFTQIEDPDYKSAEQDFKPKEGVLDG